MSRLEALHQTIAFADRDWLKILQVTVDKQSFEQMLGSLSRALVFGPGSPPQFDWNQTEFTLETYFGKVLVKKDLPEKPADYAHQVENICNRPNGQKEGNENE